jgi:hypothetical protein
MPSLLGTAVAANYGRMTPQDPYGVGAEFSSFGTRPMRLLLIAATSVTRGSFILQDGSTADGTVQATAGFDSAAVGWKQPNSLFSRLVRVVQTFGEVYMVGAPDATNFQILVSADTVNDADSTNSNKASTTYTLLEAALAAEVAATNVATTGLTNSSVATITVTASGTAANKNIFVGASLATQA